MSSIAPPEKKMIFIGSINAKRNCNARGPVRRDYRSSTDPHDPDWCFFFGFFPPHYYYREIKRIEIIELIVADKTEKKRKKKITVRPGGGDVNRD